MTDWTTFTALDWESTPVRLTGGSPPLAVPAAYAVMVAAAGPFRQGTRFRTLPEVRFHSSAGRIAAAGELLPGPDDHDLTAYLDRQRPEPFLLTVREPLLLDYPLWSQVRSLVEPLWELIGVPVVPVGTELVVTGGLPQSLSVTGYQSLLWVLHGHVTVRYGGQTLAGSPGELLSWPAGSAEVSGDSSLWLRLQLPTDGKLASQPVTELLLSHLDHRRGSNATPYLPLAGAPAVMEPLADTAAGLAELSRDPDVERSLRVQWAKRVSAAAVEPVPDPRPSELEPGQTVRSAARVYRMPDGDRSLWAVNGHAFPIGGGDAVLAGLTAGDLVVDDGPALPLLRRLHSLRALEVVG